ncbi:MAG: response regulator [Leptolyngbyaceae bacterium]|nr:response regulator [Leptolyngbyaceae bacterium]
MAIHSDIRDQAYQFFIQEAPDLLQVIESGLLTLGQDRKAADVHQLMRAAHSLKGGASSVGLEAIATIAHRLENIFKVFYDDSIVIDSSVEHQLLHAYDCLKNPLQSQIDMGAFDAEEALTVAEPVFNQLEMRYETALAEVENYVPTSEDLGMDMMLSIFEVDVAQGIDHLVQVTAQPYKYEVAGELRAQVDVLAGFAEILGLKSMGAVADATKQALARNPDRALEITQFALQDFEQIRHAVLSGDRTPSIQPSNELLTLANHSIASPSNGMSIADIEMAMADDSNSDIDITVEIDSDDAYMDDAYMDDSYMDDSYVNDAYMDDSYVNDAYMDDSYVNDAYAFEDEESEFRGLNFEYENGDFQGDVDSGEFHGYEGFESAESGGAIAPDSSAPINHETTRETQAFDNLNAFLSTLGNVGEYINGDRNEDRNEADNLEHIDESINDDSDLNISEEPAIEGEFITHQFFQNDTVDDLSDHVPPLESEELEFDSDIEDYRLLIDSAVDDMIAPPSEQNIEPEQNIELEQNIESEQIFENADAFRDVEFSENEYLYSEDVATESHPSGDVINEDEFNEDDFFYEDINDETLGYESLGDESLGEESFNHNSLNDANPQRTQQLTQSPLSPEESEQLTSEEPIDLTGILQDDVTVPRTTLAERSRSFLRLPTGESQNPTRLSPSTSLRGQLQDDTIQTGTPQTGTPQADTPQADTLPGETFEQLDEFINSESFTHAEEFVEAAETFMHSAENFLEENGVALSEESAHIEPIVSTENLHALSIEGSLPTEDFLAAEGFLSAEDSFSSSRSESDPNSLLTGDSFFTDSLPQIEDSTPAQDFLETDHSVDMSPSEGALESENSITEETLMETEESASTELTDTELSDIELSDTESTHTELTATESTDRGSAGTEFIDTKFTDTEFTELESIELIDISDQLESEILTQIANQLELNTSIETTPIETTPIETAPIETLPIESGFDQIPQIELDAAELNTAPLSYLPGDEIDVPESVEHSTENAVETDISTLDGIIEYPTPLNESSMILRRDEPHTAITVNVQATSEPSAAKGGSIVPIRRADIQPSAKPVQDEQVSSATTQPTNRRPAKPSGVKRQTAKRTLTTRVDSTRLERMNNLVGELAINREGLALQNEQLQSVLRELLKRFSRFQTEVSRLREVSDQLLIAPERYGYQSNGVRNSKNGSAQPEKPPVPFPFSSAAMSAIADPTSAEFDPLEMDRYGGLHSQIQGILEDLVQLEETVEDINLFARQSDQTLEKQRYKLIHLRDELIWARMLPMGEILNRFPRVLRDLSRAYQKPVNLRILGTGVLVDKGILEKLYDPLLHLLRNAFDHGIEPPALRQRRGKPENGQIEIRAFHKGNQTVLEVSDDGQGISYERIRNRILELGWSSPAQVAAMSADELLEFIFMAGFSTARQVSQISGRGVGLDVVRSQIQAIKGTITINSSPGKGTTFTLYLPLTLTIAKLITCVVGPVSIALPSDSIEEILTPQPNQINHSANQRFLNWKNKIIPVHRLIDLLEYNCPLSETSVSKVLATIPAPRNWSLPMLIFRREQEYFALEVDRLINEQELVLKPFGGAIAPPKYAYGSAILGDGSLVPVIDAAALLKFRKESAEGTKGEAQADPQPIQPARIIRREIQAPTILVVDDAVTIRRTLSLSLSRAGFRVLQARDGREALDQLQQTSSVNLVICDIEMPNMNGFEFLTHRRQDRELAGIPTVMLTSRGNDKHRWLAKQLGATAYFTKPYLEQEFLSTIKDMITTEKDLANV